MTMPFPATILSIESAKESNGRVEVVALIEDALQVRAQTFAHPAEYGPGLCQATITLYETEWPMEESEQMALLQELQPEWLPVEDWEML